MYELSRSWNQYYRETDPGKRKDLLSQLLSSEDDDGANAYRAFLYEKRYVDPKDPSRELDRLLFQCVNFVQLYKTSRLFAGKARKDLLKILEELGLLKYPEYAPAGETAVYWEIRNAACRYFESCRGSEYQRVFGFMDASESHKAAKMTEDAWQMSRGVALKLSCEAEMRIWCRAVMDEHAVQYEGAAEKYLEADEKYRKQDKGFLW